MQKILTFIVLVFGVLIVSQSNAQILEDTTIIQDSTIYRIVTTDNDEKIGYIIKQDERELTFLTSDNRRIIIPQYVIKKIEVIKKEDFNASGEFVGEDKFATRYFITTNGLPVKAGEHYIQWNLFGPDFQFAVGKNFGLGILTTWFAVPIVGTAKYSFELGPQSQLAIGTMLGTSSWARFTSDFNFGGILPFASLSFGNRKANLAFSGGYGGVWIDGEASGRPLASVAGMIKVSSKISLVFDSFIVLRSKSVPTTEQVYDFNTGTFQTITVNKSKPGVGLFIPGVRIHQSEGKALQFGFMGIATDGEMFPAPIPTVQWYRTL
jgi:hypothetical protein